MDCGLRIIFGSQTGTAKDVAILSLFQAQSLLQGPVELYQASHLSFESFLSQGASWCHLFVVSTTGEGQEPDNFKPFWRHLLSRQLTSGAFSDLRCVIIGLGDSSYDKFNFCAKRLHRRLLQLGASFLLEPCLADEQSQKGPFCQTEEWLKQFFALFSTKPSSKELSANELFLTKVPLYKEICRPDNEPSIERVKEDLIWMRVKKNVRVTAEDYFQDTRLITLEGAPEFISRIRPGDYFSVYPQNTDLPSIEKFLEVTGLSSEKNTMIQLRNLLPPWSQGFFPTQAVTLSEILQKYLAVTSVPQRSFFVFLSCLAHPDSHENERLKELASSTEIDDFYSYVIRPKRTIVEVLVDFPETAALLSNKVHLLLNIIPPILPRSYSVAGLSSDQPATADLLVAVVKFSTTMASERLGLASNYLAQLQPGEDVCLSLGTGTFTLPPPSPVLMVATGTGIAPFHLLLQDRAGQGFGKHTVVFGCRYQHKDFYFAHDWEKWSQNGFCAIHPVFSREGKRQYVTSFLKENEQLLRSVIETGGTLLVSGSSGGVGKALKLILKDVFLDSFQELQRQKRIQFECYS